jgi:tetratricopeptide (TPR) repeat protein
MDMQVKRSWWSRIACSAVAAGLLAAAPAVLAQDQGASRARSGQQGQGEGSSAPTIDEATGTALNKASAALNMGKYAEAQAAVDSLKLDRLSPYERSKVEQIMFQISYAQEKYADARGHLQKAIDAGGLNEQEISTMRYQAAQLYMTEEKWKEGAAALEEWFKTAVNPNSAAYYLLAVAYYQQASEANDDRLFDKALPPAQKAVELMDKPQEGWIGMLLALYLQKDNYKDAIPLLHRLIAVVPEKKTYWMQLSAVYGQMEDYPNALAVMQLAYGAGLVTEDSEVRRLADLLLFNDVPYRGAQVLETGIEKKTLNLDDKLYEKLANCWIAAGELEKAIPPLQKGAEIASSGDLFVRLGEVNYQRENWTAAQAALERGISKGQLKDAANAQLMMGIVLYSQKKLGEARPWFERAAQSEKHRQMARGYLQLIQAQG